MQAIARRFTNALRLGDQLRSYASLQSSSHTKNHRLPHGYNAPTAMSLLLKELYRPGLKVTEVAASAAQTWKGFSEGEKQKYILQAREIGQQRRGEFERLSDERQYELESEAKQLISSRKKRAKRAKIRDLHASTGRPKRPPTAYTIFTKEYFQQYPKPKNRDESTKIIISAAEAWKNLSESEKDA